MLKNRKDIMNEFGISIKGVIRLENELNLFTEKTLKHKRYTYEQYIKIKELIANKYTLPKNAMIIKNSKDYITPNGKVYKKIGESNLFIQAKTVINQGYEYCSICTNDGKRTFRLHRIVAETFLPNKENKPIINHINGNKLDNRVENLEWCNNSHNQKHAYKNGLKVNKKGFDDSQSKPILKYSLDGEVITAYGSLREASLKENIPLSTIFNQCKNKTLPRKYNFYFRYK